MLKPRFAQIWTQITAQRAVATLPSRLARMPNSSFSASVTGPPIGLNITYQVRPLTVAPSTTGRKTIERTAISPRSFAFSSQAISTARPFWTIVTVSEKIAVTPSARSRNVRWPVRRLV